MANNVKPKSSPVRSVTIFLAVAFSFTHSCQTSPIDSPTIICDTAGCNETAQYILEYIDQTVDPCSNFYRFVCGKFINNAVIPEDKSGIFSWDKSEDAVRDKLKQSVEGNVTEEDPLTFKLLQSYYNVCLNTVEIEETSMKYVKDVLNSFGNWPVVIGQSWNETTFEWQNLIYKLRRSGYTGSMNSFLKFEIKVDEKNTTKNIITLDQAETGLALEYLSKGLEEKVVKAYYKYMVELAKILGAEHEKAKKELAKSLNFEIELAKISVSSEERRNESEFYNLKTVSQLLLEYPNIPWNEYLNQLLTPQSHVELTDEVVVKVPSFLKSLSQFLSKTPKRVLANYLLWRLIQESADYMNAQVRKVKAEFSASLSGTNIQKPRWEQCISYLSKNMRLATGALHVRKNFDKKTKAYAFKLVTELRKSVENMLNKDDWMDATTKEAALTKLHAIYTHVAYPDEFFNNEKIDKHYESLKIAADSFLKSHLNLNLFNLEYKLKQLREPVNKTNWVTHEYSAVVNAFYEYEENSIPGILQGEFFKITRPNYMNYGAIGTIIGHEFIHGFDDKGSQYDKNGNLANWWNIDTQKEYLKRAECIINQYSNYTVEELGINLNGKNTRGENIADNVGFKEAYYAYENYEIRNGKEPRLPGLPYSPRQMFWISAANVWCGKRRPENLKDTVITDVHSPEEFRVIVPFSNIPEFARDFNCPVGSPMNPTHKCTVW